MPNDLSPTRGFSFRDHARSKPNMPLPGDRLDTELDRIYQAFGEIEKFLGVSLDGDGRLRGSTVSERNLAGDLFADVSRQVLKDANDLLSTIRNSESAIQSFLTQSRNVLEETKLARDNAQQALSAAETALTAARSAATDAAQSRSTTTTALSTLSARSQDALDAANSARLSEDMAFRWAEKLDGPVFVPGGGDPVDDGFYSAKYWAIWTQIRVDQGSYWFLGASNEPPTQANDGGPLAPGMWYFDLDNAQTFIWNGTLWEPISGAMGNVLSVFGRQGLVTAREDDYAAFYPLKAPTEAHIAATNNPHNTSWANLLGKPATFPPSAHTHTEAQISDLDKYTQGEVDTFIADLDTAIRADVNAIDAAIRADFAAADALKLDQAQVDARIPIVGDPRFTRWAGSWSPGTYSVNQIVTHNEGTWIAVVASTTEEPGVGADWVAVGTPGGGLFRGENGLKGNSTTGAGDIFRVHEQELNTDVTIDADENAIAAGPLTVALGVTLTVTNGGNLAIV